MTHPVCAACGRVLLYVSGALRCCNVHCTTGHQDLATPPPASRRRALAADSAGGEHSRPTHERTDR